MNNFEKWKRDLTIRDFGLFLSSKYCDLCPAKSECKKNEARPCCNVFHEWAYTVDTDTTKVSSEAHSPVVLEGQACCPHDNKRYRCEYQKTLPVVYKTRVWLIVLAAFGAFVLGAVSMLCSITVV